MEKKEKDSINSTDRKKKIDNYITKIQILKDQIDKNDNSGSLKQKILAVFSRYIAKGTSYNIIPYSNIYDDLFNKYINSLGYSISQSQINSERDNFNNQISRDTNISGMKEYNELLSIYKTESLPEVLSDDFKDSNIVEKIIKIYNLAKSRIIILENEIKKSNDEYVLAKNMYYKSIRNENNIRNKTTIVNKKKNYYDELNKKISLQETALQTKNETINLETNFIESLSNLLNTSKTFNEIINKIKFKNIDNKLFYIFKTDFKKLKKIKENLDNIQKKTNIEELIKDINNFFVTKNSTQLFDKLLCKATNSNQTEKITPILQEYSNYNKNLTNKIKVLLNNINKQNIKLDTNHMNMKILNFKNYIIKNKINKYNKIYNDLEIEHSRINGSIKYIVSCTNVIYLYFINLLIIIDFLTYFYS